MLPSLQKGRRHEDCSSSSSLVGLGCPVISFARGVAPELILHGMTGFLVETVEEMASAMTEIAALNRYEVHQHVARHFSAQVMAEKYLAIYSKLL